MTLVVVRIDRKPVYPNNVGQRFRRPIVKAGMPLIRFHDCGTPDATLALQAGIHPKIVRERCGHASTPFTLDIYRHASAAGSELYRVRMGALDDAIGDLERREHAFGSGRERTVPPSERFEQVVEQFLSEVRGETRRRPGQLFARRVRSWTLLTRNGDGPGDSYDLVRVDEDGGLSGHAVIGGAWLAEVYENRVCGVLAPIHGAAGLEDAAIEAMARIVLQRRRRAVER